MRACEFTCVGSVGVCRAEREIHHRFHLSLSFPSESLDLQICAVISTIALFFLVSCIYDQSKNIRKEDKLIAQRTKEAVQGVGAAAPGAGGL